MKPTKCSAKEKRGEERKQKVKLKTAVSLFKLKTYLKILLSAHAQTNILHLDEKAMMCMTCKWLCGKF